MEGLILNSSCSNFGLLAAVSCTKVHSVTVNKCKFAHFVQETAANHPNLDNCYIFLDFNMI